jgi:hypothetical protein
LPLHIVWRIRASVLQSLNVIDHVPGRGPLVAPALDRNGSFGRPAWPKRSLRSS